LKLHRIVLIACLATLIAMTAILAGGVSSGQSPAPVAATPTALPPPPYTGDWAPVVVVTAQHLIYRQHVAGQINYYLAGSPMAGLGECIVLNAERTGVSPYLCPAIATAESSNGRAMYVGSFNAWGMLGCQFASWENGVQRFFDNIIVHWGKAQSAFELNGYCVPDQPWMSNVQSVAEAIARIEI
jgi:hypothetical protein